MGLGREFHGRGARLDEQMGLLRALRTEPAVTFHGSGHDIDGAGINPLPLQRPVPMWVGGKVRATVRRAAQHDDGWILAGDYLGRPPDDDARQMLDWLQEESAATGRRPGELGVQGLFSIGRVPESEWAARAEAWRQFGATDLLVDTGVSALGHDASLNTVDAQVQALQRMKEALGVPADARARPGASGMTPTYLTVRSSRSAVTQASEYRYRCSHPGVSSGRR